MKKFIIHILSLLLITLLIMYILDYTYTQIYLHSATRTKTQYLQKQKEKKIDYIFIGSSRVQNSIISSLIEKRTNKSTLNLGCQGAKLHDIYTVLQLIKYYNIQYEKIFIQVDYIYNIKDASTIFQPEVIPFIYQNDIYKNHIKNTSNNYFNYYYIPFYRYCRNDVKIGFREICLNLANKKTSVMDKKGYSPLYGVSSNHVSSLPEKINSTNIVMDSILQFCSKNKINVSFYCAPFCSHTKNLNFVNKLQSKLPNLIDFSKVVKNENFFQNPNHLNDDGAKYFTNYFIDNVLINKQ